MSMPISVWRSGCVAVALLLIPLALSAAPLAVQTVRKMFTVTI
ncbi:hypothetical protein EDF73_11054 [Raoultella sp. BIGb0138]|nr:hypothetical protein EDF73_11054 [Raoultella sp. BIGb0138]